MTVDHIEFAKDAPACATIPRIVRARRSPSEAASGVARLSEDGRMMMVMSVRPDNITGDVTHIDGKQPLTWIYAQEAADDYERAHERSDDCRTGRCSYHTRAEHEKALQVAASRDPVSRDVVPC